MNPVPTHIQVAPGDGATVTVRPTDDGRWFRVLNWLVDAGYWALLPDAQRNVLIVLARHRREDGLSAAGLDALCAGSGLAKPTAYKALAGLLAHKPALVRKHGPELWELFPDRPFATRRRLSVDTAESPPRESSLCTENQVSRQRLLAPPLSSHSSPPARSERETTTTDAGSRARRGEGRDETDRVVALLEREGFAAGDARRLVATGGAARVRMVLANAEHLARAGKLRNRRGYIAKGIREGWSLFAVVEKRAARALAEKLSPLMQEGRWPLTPHQTERISRQFGGGTQQPTLGLVRAGVVSEAEINELDALELVGVIAARVEGGVMS